MNETSNSNKALKQQEQEIDLIELAFKVWGKRKFIFKVCGIAVVVGLIIALSIPKKYTTTIVSVPELQNSSSKSGLSNIASMMGFDLSAATGSEALSPMIYPEIVKSTPFIVDLFDIHVTSEEGEIDTTYYVYLQDFQKSAWWDYIFLAPKKAIGWCINLFKEEEVFDPTQKPDPFHLSIEQNEIVKAINKNISVFVDTKNGTITLNVSAQDPLISATLAQEVMTKLQNHITEYRTNKANIDLKFYETMCQEAKENYYQAQQNYATFVDRHQNVVYASFKTEQDRLNNEMQLNYNLYNQISQQLQAAQIKVQETKPVYTIIQPASVPIKGSPSRAMVLIVIVFLAGCGAVGWILVKDWLRNVFHKKKESESEV
ncbi:MAG: Wzz/FepE/Etk N-terminal domain-containing protein [Bacteroidales bacterium]|nr:Wzz/FepE/Etk N-terminal domain-containing protein [Bacteroidales bacterium]